MGKKSNVALDNMFTQQQYIDILYNLSLSTIKWKNLPDTCCPLYLEKCLFYEGKAIFFYDDILGFLNMKFTTGGGFDIYKEPIIRYAFADNDFRVELDKHNSVIIYNNLAKTNSIILIRNYAQKLALIDRIIDTNINVQKTPFIVEAEQNERATIDALFKKYDGNSPLIVTNKGFKQDSIKIMNIDTPFKANELYELKTKIWNEALTYLGISNISYEKNERLITDEVLRGQGGVVAMRQSRMLARQMAANNINEMYNLNVEVEFTEDYNFNGGERTIE